MLLTVLQRQSMPSNLQQTLEMNGKLKRKKNRLSQHAVEQQIQVKIIKVKKIKSATTVQRQDIRLKIAEMTHFAPSV